MSCKDKKICKQKDCGCPIPDLSAKCVIYDGETLSCIGADIPDNLNNLLKKFDKAICEKLNTVLQKGDLVNVGGGIELYKGIDNQGRREIRTLVSTDSSVIIELNEQENKVDLKVQLPEDIETFTLENESETSDANIVSQYDDVNKKYTFKGLKSDSINIQEDQQGNILLEVSVQSDVTEIETSSPAYIKNQNPVKTITSNYTVTEEDNNFVILVNSTNNPVTITIPSVGLPENNFFVGFLQKGNGDVDFTGYDVKPSQFQDIIQGEGHNAAIEIIEGEVFLIGALKEIV